jgi:hypothetical protein
LYVDNKGKRYDLSMSKNREVEIGGNLRPPRKVVIYAPDQKLLKYLYGLGMKNVLIKDGSSKE